MKKILVFCSLAMPALGGPYDMKCELIASSNLYDRIRRCENSEAVCYIYVDSGSISCHSKTPEKETKK